MPCQRIFFPKSERIFPDHFLAKRQCRPGAKERHRERKGENPCQKDSEGENDLIHKMLRILIC